jgi:ribosomal-protein-alanine N-acetyltransferase
VEATMAREKGCPVLETQRLRLRPLKLSDDAAILALRSHPVVLKYVEMKPYQDLARAQKFIRSVTQDIELEEAYFWGLTLKGTDYVVGTLCIWNFEEGQGKAEIGYELHPDYHHKGIMREALAEVMAFIKNHRYLLLVDAITHIANEPSKRLLNDFAFKLLGRAIDIEPEIEEGPEMILYRLEVEKGQH